MAWIGKTPPKVQALNAQSPAHGASKEEVGG